MFSGALFWSGEHLCHALTKIVSAETLYVCIGREQIVGSIAALWAVLLLAYWRLFAK